MHCQGELLGVLCKFKGPDIYERCKDQIREGVRSNLERHGLGNDSDSTPGTPIEQPESILSSSPNTTANILERVCEILIGKL